MLLNHVGRFFVLFFAVFLYNGTSSAKVEN